MSDRTLTLGASLSAPMQPDSDAWEITQERKAYQVGPVSAHALITNLTPRDGVPRWHAFCLVVEGDGLNVYCGSAAEAKAAVEAHIAGQVRQLMAVAR